MGGKDYAFQLPEWLYNSIIIIFKDELIMSKKNVKKAVLAYSGGLDTSVILKWLQDEYQCEVATFTADIGQEDDFSQVKGKALKAGIKEKDIFVDDLKEEFVRDYVFPMFRMNALYEGKYLLGTSIARPLIAKRQIEIAKQVGADAVSHGATGKGNDQVRFELGYFAFMPEVKIIAPWREWDLNSRTKLLDYARKNGIDVPASKLNEPPYSMDANLLHISYEGKVLEDPWERFSYDMLVRTVDPQKAPDKATEIEIEFEKGDPVAINGKKLSPAAMLTELNRLGGENGIGVIDLVENRYVGMKSRGIYETPGGTILMEAHRAIESITLDRELAHLKDDLMPRYASLVYCGYWFSPERLAIQALCDESQKFVNGTVALKLYKGSVNAIGRKSKDSLYKMDLVTFEEDNIYNQRDAEGFIKLNGLRLKLASKRGF